MCTHFFKLTLVTGLLGPGRFGPAYSARTVRSLALSALDSSVPDFSSFCPHTGLKLKRIID